MSKEDQTPEQVARASLASLNKSANVTPSAKLSGTERRDKALRAQPNYSRPEWMTTEETSKASSPASTILMEKLWSLMTDLYGHKWTSVHGLEDASGVWGKALSGVDKYQIAAGAKACALSGEAWPPSAPEFRAMCFEGGSDLGIPDPIIAWREAVEASSNPATWKFSHPIVQEAGKLTDWFSIRTGMPKAETIQNRFMKRYAELTTKLQRGEHLVASQALLAHEKALSDVEESEKANENLIKQRIKDQGLDKKTPTELRAEMLAKMGIKR